MKRLKNLVLHFLRVLTPEDLEEIVAHVHVDEKIAVGQNPSSSSKSRKLFLVEDPPASLEDMGIISNEKIKEQLKQEEEEARKKSLTEEELLLDQRIKWKETEEKMHQLSGLESYKKSADSKLLSFTFREDNDGKKRNPKTNGILINRKQA